MLKRMASKKIMIGLSCFFALLLIYLIPKEDFPTIKEEVPKELEYVNGDYHIGIAYLLTQSGLLGRAEVLTSKENSIEAKAKELLEVLIQEGSGESKIPSGFKAILPSDTKILSVKYEDGVMKVNFSKEVLDVSKEEEEKVIEAIVYTLTSIPEVKKVILYKEGDILDQLPQSKITLPSTLDRKFGINKKYDFSNILDLTQVTIYYIDQYNDQYYYVPVTKYINDDREKIKIVIDELTGSSVTNTNLMSFLNSNTKLLAVEQMENQLNLEFNSYIFDNIETKNILEEVIYTIALSAEDNYEVDSLCFQVDKEEVYHTKLSELLK